MHLHKKISHLLALDLPSESFVKEILKHLEFLEARLALLALSEWQQADKFYPFLYQPLTALLRPVWGAWHHLLIQLFKARKELLNSQLQLDKDKAQNLTFTVKLKEYFDRKLSDTDYNIIISAGDFLELKDPFFRVSRLWEIAVVLRNHQAHFYPNSEWYDKAAEFLKLIAKHLLATLPTEILDDQNNYKSPWFKQIDNNLFQFGGLKRTDAVNYLHFEQDTQTDEQIIDTFSRIYAKLIGEQTENADDLKKLIQKTMPEELAGVYIKNYYLGKPVAEGGFAFIHKAVNLNTGSVVAVKILKDGADSVTKERFKNEAELLSRATHNNIVKVFDYGEAVWTKGDDKIEGEWYEQFKNSRVKTFIVMEWIDGSSLKQLFDLHKPESEKKLINWFKQSALALQYIHDINLIHRDIKPGNIMVDRFGEVKIMDFGIAKSSLEDATSLTFTGQTIGTPVYMSPEQIELESKEKELTSATDIYSLCATFYEMITNNRLYHSDTTDIHTINTKKLKGEMPEAPLKLVKGLDSQLNEILLGGLRTEPAQRYKSMKALAEDLERYLANKPILYKKPNVFKRFKLVYRRNQGAFKVAGAALVVLVVAGLGFGYFMQQKQIEVELGKKQVAVVSDSLKIYSSVLDSIKTDIKEKQKEVNNSHLKIALVSDSLKSYSLLLDIIKKEVNIRQLELNLSKKQVIVISDSLNNYTEQINSINEDIKLKPSALNYAIRAHYFSKTKQFKAAIRDLEKSIKLEPLVGLYYELITQIFLDEEIFNSSMYLYNRNAELNKPKNATDYGIRSLYYMAIKKYNEAIDNLTKAIKINPKNEIVISNRASCYYFIKEYDKAIKDYTSAIEINQNDFGSYIMRANSYEKLEQYSNAIDDYSKLIDLDKKDYKYYLGRAYAYSMSKCYQSSLDDFNYAIAIDPQNPWGYALRGECNVRLKNYENALKDYSIGIGLDSINYPFFALRYEAYYLMGHWNKALSDINRALAFNNSNDQMHFDKASILAKLDRNQEAIDIVDKIRAACPDNKQCYSYLGYFYNKEKKYDRAIYYLKKAIMIKPSEVDYFNMGMSLYATSQINDAKENFKISQEMNPNIFSFADPDGLYALGDVYLSENDTENAIKYFKLSASKDYQPAKDKLNELGIK